MKKEIRREIEKVMLDKERLYRLCRLTHLLIDECVPDGDWKDDCNSFVDSILSEMEGKTK